MSLFSKDINSLDDLFIHTLRDIYYAEQLIVKSLPKMVDKATNTKLKMAFEKHLGETRNYVARTPKGLQDAWRGGLRLELPGDRRHHQGSQRSRRRG